jgi:hypothetical protein
VTHRVSAHVDDVNGYSGCLLSIEPGSVRLQLCGPVTRLFHPRMFGTTLTHAGAGVTLARIRWQVPWLRAALLLFTADHRVVLPMSPRKAGVIAADIRASGTTVDDVHLGSFDGPGQVVGLQQYHYLRGRRTWPFGHGRTVLRRRGR